MAHKKGKGMTGKHHSEKTKERMREIKIGRKLSKEHREKCGKHLIGKKHTDETKRKMSKAHIGINEGLSLSEEHKKKIGYANSGEKNSGWLGGKSFEPYTKDFNNKFKRAIRKRDNQICMLCNIHREKLKTALDVHHINYDKILSIKENCISLCKSCHMKTRIDRNKWEYFFQSLLYEKYNYEYKNGKVVLKLS